MSNQKTKKKVIEDDLNLQTFQVVSDDDTLPVIKKERKPNKADFEKLPPSNVNKDLFKGILVGLIMVFIYIAIDLFVLK